MGASRKGEDMKLSIELVKEKTVLQEPVWVRLRFQSDSKAVNVPVDYDSADVIQLFLFNSDGEMLGYGDSYKQSARLGLVPEPVSQISMETAKLGRGKTMEWLEDLLAYMDIKKPGDYLVQAKFKFQPSQIDVESEKTPLTITKNNCSWISFHRDQVAIGMIYGIQQHVLDGDAATFYHIRNDSNPVAHWKSGEIKAPASAQPRISEADFVSLDSFDHDFTRWVAWLKDRSIRLTRFTDIKPDKKIYDINLDFEAETMVGRPVQHEDGGVSILLTHQTKQNITKLSKLDISAKGKLLRDAVIARFTDPPFPLVSSAKYNETIFLVFAQNGSLPVKLMTHSKKEGVKERVLLTMDQYQEISEDSDDIGNIRILSIVPVVKAFAATSPAVLACAVVEKPNHSIFSMIRIPLENCDKTEKPIRIVESPLEKDFLQDGESIDHGAIADAPAGKLHGIFTTTSGRIFGFTETQSLGQLAKVAPEKTQLAELITALNESVYLLYPTEDRGVQHVMIQSPQTP